MIPKALLLRWFRPIALAIGLTIPFVGCVKVPRQFVQMAEPGATLTALNAQPELYRGKVVLLGGTIVEEEENEQYLWLRVKNRPLDQDYVPHRPVDTGGPEAGHYWVMIPKQQIPREYRHWARMTVVGRVTGKQRLTTEPVLSLLYVRGWGTSRVHDAVWEDSSDPNYVPSMFPWFRQALAVNSAGVLHSVTRAALRGRSAKRFHLALGVSDVEASPPSVR